MKARSNMLLGLKWKLILTHGTAIDRFNFLSDRSVSLGKRGNTLLGARLRRLSAAGVIRDPAHLPKVGFLLRVGASTNYSSLDLDAMNVVR